ncbi:MAG TPA: 50S ribosomal protein L25 [Phycisphaerae bacterium]|nr:50S ribosomal protein L25 [Phycisphaerae bacterium]
MGKTTETLHAEKREAKGTRACTLLRAAGQVPAILYGHKEEPVAIQVPEEELVTALRQHSRMFELHVGRHKDLVLLKEVQHDSFGDEIVHADFVRVAMDEKIRLEVPIQLKGTPKVEHTVLQQTLGQLEIECLPKDIPAAIVVPVGDLVLDQSLHVREVVPPPGVKILTDPEVIVATLTAVVEEVAPAAAPAMAEGPAEPEVIGRKAEPEVGEEGEEAEEKEKEKKEKKEKKEQK